ncbi:DUF1028 domain-containing protein [Microbacterium sp. zg.Y1090]|uniref:DUF1028 domain-containing protein n=1 Tax=Microbacterium TaxID=33882 RepID=UPI00214C4210|nr:MULTISPECIES: DUF1028 domain-containing protein [unclassified Microbacterium]MCR2812715.1 DUF1028 domain-containing protein [Microbacterium sp. zg.Y1084]MCR2817491.1 DUF1028 domain-containing protein [Microbacterium sp. zg.Y1090]MDL5485867.1 DUF1028 domain-containing protein [Microbacterium sp. zg-Y1211]WIM29026.1 DUF1028 domain-containing protein [Microbacterium sp. zg-Y1090]
MTLSLAARDADGAFGMVIASSSPAVASRCLHLASGVGAVASQNVTNPALGPAALRALADGAPASDALTAALASDTHGDYRQLTVVDAAGRVAVHSGSRALGIHGHRLGEGCVAAGNMLAGDDVLEQMVAGFTAAAGSFEERLLAGLEAAQAAGGEAGPLRSAGLAVVSDAASWRVTDLRVDDHAEPVAELRRLVGLWLPQKSDYLIRAIDPSAAPSYGVPGDE